MSHRYDKTTHMYIDNGKAHKRYWLFPTSFYISLINDYRKRAPDGKVFIFCETLQSPACQFFDKMSSTDKYVIMRIGSPLIDDLRTMLCAHEFAGSMGTFGVNVALSLKMQTRHIFSQKPISSDDQIGLLDGSTFRIEGIPENLVDLILRDEDLSLRADVYHWIASQKYREEFQNIEPWKNTPFQRHLADQTYAFEKWTHNRTSVATSFPSVS